MQSSSSEIMALLRVMQVRSPTTALTSTAMRTPITAHSTLRHPPPVEELGFDLLAPSPPTATTPFASSTTNPATPPS
jgi:hypothetical protein